VQFTNTQQDANQAVLSAAREILNRDYTAFERHSTKDLTGYIGVTGPTGSYTELSMGAGEQRVFKILEAVYQAEKYSLILVDEIDLLLHEPSLMRLVCHVRERCRAKSIQLVFTAHRHSILSLEGVNFRHIMHSTARTFCLRETTPDALSQLNHKPVRPIRIFVEDDLAQAVVNRVLELLGARRHAEITRFGSIQNAFTLAGAAALNGNLSSNDIFVLDGDEFRESSMREARMRQVVVGDDPIMVNIRTKALGAIVQFTLAPGEGPEAHIWRALRAAAATDPDEVRDAAAALRAVGETHQYVNAIFERTGYERTTGLLRVVDSLSRTAEWAGYVAEVQTRLLARLKELGAITADAAATAPAVGSL
jgi:hypothetical protein